MDAAIELRAGGEDDGPAVARLFGAASARMDFAPRLHTPDEDRAHFTALLAHGPSLLAERGSELIGFAIFGGMRLDHLYVHPSWQGRGVGAALLTGVMRALPRGFDLWTFQANVGARRFYERHGLECVELTEGAANEEGVPDVRYVWRPRSLP